MLICCSAQSTLRVHNTFMRLDEEGNGYLSLQVGREGVFQMVIIDPAANVVARGLKSSRTPSPLMLARYARAQEFSQISGSTMSNLFLKRIFEEHTSSKRGVARDKMDLVAFTDFVLAWDHRSSPAAIKYFFPIFDLQKKARGISLSS